MRAILGWLSVTYLAVAIVYLIDPEIFTNRDHRHWLATRLARRIERMARLWAETSENDLMDRWSDNGPN